jgi:hypothetical protein
MPQQLRLQAEAIEIGLDGFKQLLQRSPRSTHFALAPFGRSRTINPYRVLMAPSCI